MPDPKALTAEQIELLRFTAEHPLVIEEDSDNFYSADYLNVCGLVDIDSGAWHINSAGRTLLACIDSTRERVLGEVDAAAQKLESFEADLRTDGTFGIGFAWDCDSETNTQVAADTFTAALFAATKKGDGDA